MQNEKASFWRIVLGGTWKVRDADGTLYLGGDYVVVRLRPREVGFTETWLTPAGATRGREG